MCVASWIIGWPDVVTLLLEAGADPSDPADPNYPDYPNEIALRQALGHYPEDGHADVARVLLNHGAVPVYYIPPVTLGVLKQDPAGLQKELSAGADPNEPDRWGQTPVEVAAQIRGGVGTELVRVLLDAGGEPSLHLVSGNMASAELCLQPGRTRRNSMSSGSCCPTESTSTGDARGRPWMRPSSVRGRISPICCGATADCAPWSWTQTPGSRRFSPRQRSTNRRRTS